MNAPLKPGLTGAEPTIGSAIRQALAAKQFEEALWQLDHRDMTDAIAESVDTREAALAQLRAHGVDADMLKLFVGDVL
jgi:hypothetical protein